MSKADCIAALVRGGIDEAKARDIVDGMAQEKKLLGAQASASDLAAAWSKQMDAAKKAAIQQRRHAALNVIKRQTIDDFIGSVKAEGFGTLDALEAMMVGSNKTFTGARQSAMSKRWGILDSWMGPMINDLEAIPGALRMMRDDESFSYAVMREMISPDSTGDEVARKTAQVFSDYAELSRQRANSAGAAIGKLDGWAPQSHDPVRMLAKDSGGVDGWTQFVTDRLDIERTFPEIAGDADAVKEALASVFTTITTGRGLGLTAAGKGVSTGPRNLAKGMGKSRVLHFKSADGAVEYHQRYGRGNILHNVLNNMEYTARNVSLMETFGPNPEAMIKGLLDTEKDAVRRDATMDAGEKSKRLKELDGAWSDGFVTTGSIARWYAELSGQTFTPVNQFWARLGSGTRGLQSMAKLGGATLSALADVFVKANALRHRGHNLLESYHGAFTQFMIEGRTDAETKALARRLGAFIDGSMSDINNRFNAQDQMSGAMSKAMNTFFKWSGLTGWTEAHKAGFITAFSRELGENAGKSFDAMDEHLQTVLRRQGITPERWGVLRKLVEKGPDGNTYLVPERAHMLSRDAILELLPESTKRTRKPGVIDAAIQRERNALETQLMGVYADECRYAIIEPDDKTRAAMVWGTRPGTFMGEALRFVTQFKSFPIAYYQRILSEGKWKRAADANLPAKLLGLSHFIVMTWTFGYLAMTLKDIAKGKKPKDPLKIDTLMAAAMQSGGAGLYGDFLFGKVSRTGNTLAENLAGPTLSTVGKGFTVAQQFIRGDVQDAGADALRFVLDNTPGINLWYTRAALDYALLFHVREMLSPGTLRRTESKMRSEYNQEYMLPPSSVIKRGGGFR